MVKQHNKTGLKYFHKTTRLDLIESYYGSGVRWNEELKNHGNDWTNIWVSEVFYDKDLCEEFALFFSDFFNVEYGQDWANKKPENGLDGGDTSKHIDYQKRSKKDRLKKWWSNDSESIHCETPPNPSYKRGRKFFNNNGFSKVNEKRSNEDLIWFTDGKNNLQRESSFSQEGWFRGRTGAFANGRHSAKGTKWFNDGKKSFMVTPDEASQKGLIKGRLKNG